MEHEAVSDESLKMLELYEMGWSIYRIAHKYFWYSPSQIRRRLLKAGVVWRTKTEQHAIRYREYRALEPLILRLYLRDKLGCYRIGQMVGISPRTVYRILKRNDIQPRSKDAAQHILYQFYRKRNEHRRNEWRQHSGTTADRETANIAP